MPALSDVLLVAINFVFIVGIAIILFSPKMLTRYAPIGTPRILGLVRIVVVSTALLYVLDTEFLRTALFIGPGYQDNFYTPVGILTPLLQAKWFLPLLGSTLFLLLIKSATIAVLVSALIGYRARLSLVLSLLMYTLYSGIILQSLLLSHYGAQVILLLGVLAVLPVHGAYSLTTSKSTVEHDVPTVAHTLSVYVVLVTLCIPYLFAVINKFLLMGTDWFNSTNIRGDLHAGLYMDSSSWLWELMLSSTQWSDWVFLTAGIGVVVLQASYFLILFSHTARLILPAGIMLMHIAIYFFMGFLFMDLILLQIIVYIIVYFSGKQTLSASAFAQRPSARYRSIALVVFFLLFTAVCTIFQTKFYPFSSWAVYANPSDYYTSGIFPYNNLRYTFADGTESTVSLDTFKREVGLFVYPRQSCYWEADLRSFEESCSTFFYRSIVILNKNIHSTNPIIGITVEQRRWSLDTLQNEPESLFTSAPAARTTFTIETDK